MANQAPTTTPLFSASHVEPDDESTPLEIVEAEEVMIDRAAFGFDPERGDTIDAEVEPIPVPMDVRPVPMKYAAAAAMMLGVLGLFVGRQMSGSGPAMSMAATDLDTVAQFDSVTLDRTAGKSYILYADAATRADADAFALRLWELGVQTTVEHDVPNSAGFALVGTHAFDLTNGLPRRISRKMPTLVDAGFNPEPIHWPR